MTDVAITFTADYEGERKKTAVLKKIPAAFFRNANDWAGITLRYIKQSYKGGRVFKRPPKELDERLGKLVRKTGPHTGEIILGTGRYINRDEVVYARIQEEGGWVVAKKRTLTIPFPGVKYSAPTYRVGGPNGSFIIKGRGENSGIIARKVGKRGRIEPLFILRRSVKLPPRRWFSRPILEKMELQQQMLSDAGVWATASQMASKSQGGDTE